MKFRGSVTRERLLEVLNYDPETGDFTWRDRPESPRWSTRYAGKVAGHLRAKTAITNLRHCTIAIDDVSYMAHRLAWLYMTGEWPKGVIDHKDHCGFNNKWENLRDATSSENTHYSRLSRNNTSGVTGVHFRPDNKRNSWQAVITVNRRAIKLGYFTTKNLAAQAYRAASIKYFGEFATDAPEVIEASNAVTEAGA